MTDRELMQTALEAMEHLHRTGDTQLFDMYAAPEIITALRERLAQPEQEPVGKFAKFTDTDEKINELRQQYGITSDGRGIKEFTKVIITALRERLAQLEQEPVGKFAKFTDNIWREVTDGSAGVSLYTTPPAAQRKPLTDEQIDAIGAKIFNADFLDVEEIHANRDIARAIEAAHGIKEST